VLWQQLWLLSTWPAAAAAAAAAACCSKLDRLARVADADTSSWCRKWAKQVDFSHAGATAAGATAAAASTTASTRSNSSGDAAVSSGEASASSNSSSAASRSSSRGGSPSSGSITAAATSSSRSAGGRRVLEIWDQQPCCSLYWSLRIIRSASKLTYLTNLVAPPPHTQGPHPSDQAGHPVPHQAARIRHQGLLQVHPRGAEVAQR
jgi:hypothetical protein